MPVDALKEVKVYEQQSDKEQMTGVSDGKKKTVMDVKTKKDLTDGLIGGRFSFERFGGYVWSENEFE